MQTSTIRKIIDEYNRGKSFMDRLRATPAAITQLNILVPANSPDRPLNPEELNTLYAITASGSLLPTTQVLKTALTSLEENIINEGKDLANFKQYLLMLPSKLHQLSNLTKLAGLANNNAEWISRILDWRIQSSLPEDLCNQANFDKLCAEERAEAVCLCIAKMPANLRTQPNIDKLLTKAEYAANIGQLLQTISSTQHEVTQSAFDIACKNAIYANALNGALYTLPENLRTSSNFFKLALLSNWAQEFCEGITRLPPALQTQDNFGKIFNRTWDLISISPGLISISANNFGQPTLATSICSALMSLPQGLQNQRNLSELLNPRISAYAIHRLISNPSFSEELKTQNNFDNICRHIDVLRELSDDLLRLPPHLLTQQVLDHIFQLCVNHHDAEAAIQLYLHNIAPDLVQVQALAPAPDYNPGQSTHTASVHASISESASNLMRRYGEKINTQAKLDTVAQEILSWAQTAVEEKKNEPEEKIDSELQFQRQKALQAAATLLNPTYAYTDVTSNISTRQFLALAWLALHDDSMRIGPLEDAMKRFTTGLYDIQRGYNLNDKFTDNKETKDKPICTPGTFNKIGEIPWGLHNDVVIIYMTSETASQKLPNVVREELMKYLNSLLPDEKATPDEKQKFVDLINEIENDGVSVVWDKIQPRVIEQMYEEFGNSDGVKALQIPPLYKSREDSKFVGLISGGPDTDITNLELKSKFKFLMEPEEKITVNKAAFFQPPANNLPHTQWTKSLNTQLEEGISFFSGKNEHVVNILKDMKKFLSTQASLTPQALDKLERNLTRTVNDLKNLEQKEPPFAKDYADYGTKLKNIKDGIAELRTQPDQSPQLKR